ncbi:MAG: sulfur oxidation c-type cytochrome SoxX [Gammaproteobacteria bacterium]
MPFRSKKFTRQALTLAIFLQAIPVKANSEMIDGRALTFETERGNCLACHQIPGGQQMGDIGPPLVDMRNRFPDRDRLHAQIWDASAVNIDTMMPPYGRQQILSDEEINAIIDFLYEN